MPSNKTRRKAKHINQLSFPMHQSSQLNRIMDMFSWLQQL